MTFEGPSRFTNISVNWLPDNLNDSTGGSHNGENYLAYTFYVENTGEMIADYWSEFVLYDVVQNVDEALRIRIYRNDEYVTYAKIGKDGEAEEGTVPFSSDDLVMRGHVASFKPGDLDKYTIVIWVEGNDPDCTDDLVGGEFKFYMDFNSEFVEE